MCDGGHFCRSVALGDEADGQDQRPGTGLDGMELTNLSVAHRLVERSHINNTGS